MWDNASVDDTKAVCAPWVEQGKLSHREFIAAEYPVQDIGRALGEIASSKPIKTLFRF